MLDSVLSCSAIGSPDTVERQLKAFIERTGADELMITSQIFEHARAPALLRDHGRDPAQELINITDCCDRWVAHVRSARQYGYSDRHGRQARRR
jgi:hypothetical protein